MSAKRDFGTAAERAAAATDRDLAEAEARLALPTAEAIRRMLPDPQDQAALDELIGLVRQDTDHNQKVAALLGNIDRVAGVVVKLVERLP